MDKYQVPKEKIQQLERLLKDHNVDCLLLLAREGSDQNLPFLIGDDAIHTAAAFFCKDGKHKMLTSSSDKAKFEESHIFAEVLIYETSIKERLAEVLGEMAPKTLALDFSEEDNTCDGLTLGLYQLLEGVVGKDKLATMEISAAPLLLELRSKKTEAEIACLREAIAITQQIYADVLSSVKLGMTEKEIGDLFVVGMKKYNVTNGIGEGYDYPIVCFSRAGLAHRGPGDTKSIPGDVLIMDFSVRYQGYVSDIARSAYFLKPGETKAPDDVQHVFNTAYKGITDAIAMCRPGVKGYEVDAVGRKTIEDGGFPTVRHSVGHQIGRECHDGGTRLATRRPGSEGALTVGEVYAIEPTVIQDDGLPCMIVEENIVVREHGPELLSKRQEHLYLIG